MSVDKTHTAVLVLNRNMREMTESLIETIQKTCTPKHTIFALEADSDSDKEATNGDIQIAFAENKRWAWSFARGIDLVLRPDSALEDPTFQSATTYVSDIRSFGPVSEFGYSWDPKSITHFWLLCNDTQLNPNMDTLRILLQNMPDDACQIHPYQQTHPEGSPQGWAGFNKIRTGRRTHNVAFVEFVCPLITRNFYQLCKMKFGCSPVGPHFPYGWGVDYEMAYFGHKLGLKSYICDAVGITHHPGTTHLNYHKTRVEDNNQMRVLARNSMLDVLEQRYGRNWGLEFSQAAVAAGVDPQAFLDWSAHDRALALKGARV